MNNKPHICTIKQLSKETGISPHTIRLWVKSGAFKSLRSGKKYLINYDIFMNFLNGENENAAPSESIFGGIRKVAN